MSLASDRPEFTPPPPPGRARAIGLAIFAHVLLIAALTWGVSWKRDATDAPVQAELWSTTAQQAAPALVEPTAATPPPQPESKPKPEPKIEPPTPKPAKVVAPPPEPTIDPQIAIEKAKKEEKKKLEKKKADEIKEKAKVLAKKEAEAEAEEEARLEALDKKKRALEAKKLDAKKVADAKKAADANEAAKEAANDAKYEASLKAAREANLKRIAGMAGASGAANATGEAKQSTGPSAGYGGRVVARIKPNIVLTDDIAGNPVATVEVRTSPDGAIIGRKIIKSSGNKTWDEAVLRALDKTEILPKDTDGRVPPSFEINFRPKDLL
jgi:colicin import membrane protein